MAKAKAQAPVDSTTAPPATSSKKRPAAASEIDDIFAKKPKPAAPPTLAPIDPPATSKKAKKAGQPATKVGDPKGAADEAAASGGLSKRVPETVVDTSKDIEGYKPAPLVQKTLKDDATEEERKAFEDEERFRDSRGLRQKTDDGLPIYNESELKIGLGGDTPLCPFDCTCCF
ncbi:hypothetical protein BMF94_4796 [Rhodotorula taiwanensis]|uniref:DUF1764 domain-containing protein n=1 Tax=Rhodotorula taiwanensis TaxID=741276 RepID=A0A2S5B5W1_9BASI|nr:hypothetical protein BMF94_4796 [Rhodotorula taiwanensis]